MNSILYIILGLLFAVIHVAAQPRIQSRKDVTYRYVGADSVIVTQKERNLDEQGRLTRKRDYWYSPQPPYGVLFREETADWESSSQTLTQKIIYYKPNQDPKIEKLEMKYLTYAATDDSSEVIWVRRYDANADLIKEDTCTYNSKKQLIKQCSYDFQGSTSLYCEVYDHNRKGLLKRWRTYSVWTTVNMMGRAAKRKDKRRDVNYHYNRKNQLVKVKGTRYSNPHLEIYKYDAQGRLELKQITASQRERLSKSAREKANTKKKYLILRDTVRQTYHQGRLLEDILITRNTLQRLNVATYQEDSLLVNHSFYGKNKVLQETREYTYYPNKKMATRIVKKYDDKGALRVTTQAAFDNQGRIAREEQIVNNKMTMANEYQYDEYNNLLIQILYNSNNIKLEKTFIDYKYY